MQKITPCLWFESQAEEAARFYTSVFKNSRILDIARNLEGSPAGEEGSALTVSFELEGQEFLALNGGPVDFHFNEAVSLSVDCANQREVDDLWEKLLSGGGEESQCGWLKDRYGLSWQIVPRALLEMLGDSDRKKAGAVMQAMLQMRKIDVEKLREAYQAG